jgi:hypothetical protein
MSAENETAARRAICMSLRRVEDVYEVGFEDVDESSEGRWKSRGRLSFLIVTPDEINGKMSEDRAMKLGLELVDKLWYLARIEGRQTE